MYYPEITDWSAYNKLRLPEPGSRPTAAPSDSGG
jgi:hypothetical protein